MCKKLILTCISILLVVSAAINAAAPVDDWQTIGLWHLDGTVSVADQYAAVRDGIADDNSVTKLRNNFLILGWRGSGAANGGDNVKPAVVSGGVYGNALSFDGVDDQAYSASWANNNAVVIDFYIKPAVIQTSATVVIVTSVFEIRLMSDGTNAYFNFYTTDAAGTKTSVSRKMPWTEMLSSWHRVVAAVDGSGNVSIDFEGATIGSPVTAVVAGLNNAHHNAIYLSGTWTHTRPYNGLLDEVKISDPTIVLPAFLSPYQDNYNTFLLYHFNEISDQSPARTPDDDSYNPGRSLTPARDLDGILQPSGEPYAGPTLVTSFGGDPNEGFGRCLQFNGFQNIKVQGTDENDAFGIPNDNFRIELWAVHDAAKLNDGYEYYFFHQPSRFRFSLRDLAGGVWGIRFVTWTASTGAASVLDVTVPDAAVWHHYAFEFYQGVMKTYIDGVAVGQLTTIDTSVAPAIRQLFIGSDNLGGRKIIGRIDEFKISRAVDAIPECGAWGYSPADINQDCYVNDLDIIEMARQWLVDCTQPGNELCL